MSLSGSSVENSLLQQVKVKVVANAHLQDIVQQSNNHSVSDGQYMVREGLLYWKHRLVMPAESPLIQQILTEYHSSPIGGHVGITRTTICISAQFYWPNMRKDVQKFIAECVICQQAKHLNTLPAGCYNLCQFPIRYGRMLQWIS